MFSKSFKLSGMAYGPTVKIVLKKDQRSGELIKGVIMNSILCTLLLSLIFVFPSAQSGQKMENEHSPKLSFATGPNINDRVPDFALPDQYGVMRSIGDLVKSKGAILNFYRSASW